MSQPDTKKYAYRKIEGSGDLRECKCCGAEAPLRLFDHEELLSRQAEPYYLCELCANTSAGNSVPFPDNYPDIEILRHVCAVGNLVIDACTGRRKDALCQDDFDEDDDDDDD